MDRLRSDMLQDASAVFVALIAAQAAAPPEPWYKTWGGIAGLCVTGIAIITAVLTINRFLTLALLESSSGQARFLTLLQTPAATTAIITAMSTPTGEAVLARKVYDALDTPNGQRQIISAVEADFGKTRLLIVIKEFLTTNADVQRQVREAIQSPEGQRLLLSILTSPPVFVEIMDKVRVSLFMDAQSTARLVELAQTKLTQLAKEGKLDEIYSSVTRKQEDPDA